MKPVITAIVLSVTGLYMIGKTMSVFVGGSVLRNALDAFGIYW